MTRSIFSAALLEKAAHDKGLQQAIAEVEDYVERKRDVQEAAAARRAFTLFGLYVVACILGFVFFGRAGGYITTCGLPIAYVVVTEAWWWLERRRLG